MGQAAALHTAESRKKQRRTDRRTDGAAGRHRDDLEQDGLVIESKRIDDRVKKE